MRMQEINTCYDEKFYSNQSVGSYKSARQVVPFIIKYLKPQSVVDIGCGIGTWLKVFQESGVNIKGIDGEYVNEKQLMIDINDFQSMNLEEPIVLNQKFDLVMSLEVAEHLSEERGRNFIEDLTRLGDVILFSAAVPLQGGTHHINERRLSYWKSIFEEFQFRLIDCIRPLIWDNKEIDSWYKQNMVFFINNSIDKNVDCLEKMQEEKIKNMIDIIHPDLYEEKLNRLFRGD